MAESISFSTRARTIDHLGREQIADCPTAISELWKNSYDAYARTVDLHIFDGKKPVATLVDDGHGMDYDEFKNKWLTIGTESKTSGYEVPLEDRNGLVERPKQGQKGIGRLSCAALGSLLLIVTKRKKRPFVASLIDWRLFENPFLLLQDVRIPVIEFATPTELVERLPELFDKMMGNIWGDTPDGKEDEESVKARNLRVTETWEQYSKQELLEKKDITTKDRIVNTLIQDVFNEDNFSTWSVWNKLSPHGTAMFMTDIHPDLTHQLSTTPIGDAPGDESRARTHLKQTLSDFVDEFHKQNVDHIKDFSTSVTSWVGRRPRPIIENSNNTEGLFTRDQFDDLEHIVEGTIDEEGYFSGRVRAFGVWHEDIKIKPISTYKTRKDSRFGSFSLLIGGYEAQKEYSTLTSEQFARVESITESHGGLKVYRDYLRVMPYGREGNDYFEIEMRRSKNAGRYFWSARKTFGSINISRKDNPNLKDKAGREGLIDNKASKLFREIVENILIRVALRLLGRESNIRKEHRAEVKIKIAAQKAEADKKKLLARERSRIKTTIKKKYHDLVNHLEQLERLLVESQTRSLSKEITELQEQKKLIDQLSEKARSFSLSPVPPNLGRLEKDYRNYRSLELSALTLVKQLSSICNAAITELTNKSNLDVAEEIYRSKLSSLNAKITQLSVKGKSILAEQNNEFEKVIKECRSQFKENTEELLEDLKLERITLDTVLTALDDEQEKLEIENAQKLSPYVTALSRINEQIDLEGLAIHSMNESIKHREEVARLHALAQLGITVEIVGHEIEGLDMTIARGLKTIANSSLNTAQLSALDDITAAQQALSDKWKFLSPLKLSGEKTYRKINGIEIVDYIYNYFDNLFSDREINCKATKSFENLSILEMPSRIYPVFVNIINNSQYWVERSESKPKEIILDYRNGEVIVADTGPGVDEDDLDQLFTLFFTRKPRSGRGIGLYLCKQNLQAGGHKIRYETIDKNKLLPGANFIIEFKGLKNE